MLRNYVFAGCVALVAADASAEFAECIQSAGLRYDVAPELLEAIAAQESGFDPLAQNVNADGSRDIGFMQINTRWLPKLATYGIEEADIWDPCVNINIGAWVLASNIAQFGYTWYAVGAYNAGTGSTNKAEVGRDEYARKIADRLDVLRRTGSGVLVANTTVR